MVKQTTIFYSNEGEDRMISIALFDEFWNQILDLPSYHQAKEIRDDAKCRIFKRKLTHSTFF